MHTRLVDSGRRSLAPTNAYTKGRDMDSIVKLLQRHQGFFDKISKNMYLVAIKDGFISNMPIILFSSLFLLISTLPAYVGITLPQEALDFCNKVYAYTMGVFGIMVAGQTANSLATSMNRRMPAGKAINPSSTMIAGHVRHAVALRDQLRCRRRRSDHQCFRHRLHGQQGRRLLAHLCVHHRERL